MAAVLLGAESVFWYPVFLFGAPVTVAWLNRHRGQPSLISYLIEARQTRLSIYLLFAGSGLAVELVRTVPDLWRYADPLDHGAALVLWVALLYPLFFWLIFETYVFFIGVAGHPGLAALASLGLLVLWNDLPNHFVPLWQASEPASGLLPVLFSVGYVLEVAVALVAHILVTRAVEPSHDAV